MQPIAIRDEALALIVAGVNDCEIARRLGIPRTTIRDWRRPRYIPKPSHRCPRCGGRARRINLAAEDYAELLALYLGDGHIASLARSQRLRICLDARYVDVVDETEALMQRCFPANPVRRTHFHDGAEVVLDVYSSHLRCLFPQAGPGKKHERPIVLEPWQAELVEHAPWALLRGFIRSDGCVFINRTGRYKYVSYGFSNLSTDILDLFETTARSLGLSPRRYTKAIRLNRREDVALLLAHVGTKS